MPTQEPDQPDDLIEDAIPDVPATPAVEKPDLSSPWYRPAKQYLRRQQWNADILKLLRKLPASEGEKTVLRYVGLPGQHHLDVLSMGRICHAKNLLLDYLGFRTGGGAGAKPVRLGELVVLSNQTHFTPASITYPDNIENIGQRNSVATQQFHARGPFDVVNLDVCGGVLHGDTTPVLAAIKHVLTSQAQRPEPWLLFVTTSATPKDISADVIARFFALIGANCDEVADFKPKLTEAANGLGLSAEECLRNPEGLQRDGFLRFFTLAFGKWLLANLSASNPRSAATLLSVYSFRRTDREEPEMLSLSYLIKPIATAGIDPSGLTAPSGPTPKEEYAVAAVELVAASLAGLQDLDAVWQTDAALKDRIVAECEDLLRTIGVDDAGLADWRRGHGLAGGAAQETPATKPPPSAV